jgi:two-component system, NtrC family, nitrogen regulation sensor histidine kinase NtrY
VSPRRPTGYEQRLGLLSYGVAVPGTVMALLLVWLGDFSLKLQITLTLILVVASLALAAALRRRVVYPLRTLANLLEALRIGDYSLRGRAMQQGDALSEVLREVNALRDALERERRGAVEATALLKRVMEEITVALFTFDETGRLKLVNRAGEELLAQPARRLLGQDARQLGLGPYLEGAPSRTFEEVFPGRSGRFQIRRGSFRENGLPHQLLVLTDLSRTLREEERQAWRRLIRVIGHELNNSLAPIKSMAGTLQALLSREPLAPDWQEDAASGLNVIGQRAESLSRFMASYARLARLPEPRLTRVPLGVLVRRAAALETRVEVLVDEGPEVTLEADGDQLEQALINLIRNAADATLESTEPGGDVRVSWQVRSDELVVSIEDDGPGLSNQENLFVPFYTTKPGGTGVGLVLSRQIAEAHGGSLSLENRAEATGCEARLRLPI